MTTWYMCYINVDETLMHVDLTLNLLCLKQKSSCSAV